MATKKSGKSAASKSKSKRAKKSGGARAVQERPADQAFSYKERSPIIVDALAEEFDSGGARTTELFDVLESSQFRQPRRLPATWRQYERLLPENEQMFTFAAGRFTLTKRGRAASKRSKAAISRKKTRSAK